MALKPIDIFWLNKTIRTLDLSQLEYTILDDLNEPKHKYVANDAIKYLIDVVYNVFAGSKEMSDKVLEKHIVLICLYSNFLIENYEEKIIEENIKDKLIVLKDKYLEYIVKNNKEKSENILSRFSDLAEILKFEIEVENKSEDLSRHVELVVSLETKIKELEKIIESKNHEITVLTKRNESLETIHTADISAKLTLQEQINSNNSTISKLNSMIEDLNSKLTNLKSEYDLLKIDMLGNSKKDTQIKELNDMVADQQKRISEYERKEALVEIKENTEQNLERLSSFIYTLISNNNKMTIDEILNECRKESFSVDKNDIKLALEKLSQDFKIKDDKHVVVPEKYGIITPEFVKGASLKLDAKEKDFVDLLVISDLHCKLNDLKTCQNMNAAFNYCVNEGIDMIIDLGDFLDIREDMFSKFDYENMLKFMLKTFPTDNNITHVILGGNHDMHALHSGADLLKNICDNKDGLIHLGYEHASVMFGDNNKNGLKLYHKNQKVDQHLTNGIFSENYYLNLIGHNHASKFDVMNHNIFVPSLTRDRVMNGALKIRVYFNKHKDIDYILCTLLQNDGQLIPITEVPYQKIRTR